MSDIDEGSEQAPLYILGAANDSPGTSPAGIALVTAFPLPAGRVIRHRAQHHKDLARALRAEAQEKENRARGIKCLPATQRAALEEAHAVLLRAEHQERLAANGKNLYLCAICGAWGMWGPGWAAWGNMDESEAFVCSDDCKKRHRPSKRRRGA
jgi:hypothetical protein